MNNTGNIQIRHNCTKIPLSKKSLEHKYTFKTPNRDTLQEQALCSFETNTITRTKNRQKKKNRQTKVKMKCKSVAVAIIRLWGTSVGAVIGWWHVWLLGSEVTVQQDQRWRRPWLRLVWRGTLGISGLPNGESSSEFSLSAELLWRCWANFLFSASAIRAAGSPSNAAPPLLRLLLIGVPPGDLQRKEGKCSGDSWYKQYVDTEETKKRWIKIKNEEKKSSLWVLKLWGNWSARSPTLGDIYIGMTQSPILYQSYCLPLHWTQFNLI